MNTLLWTIVGFLAAFCKTQAFVIPTTTNTAGCRVLKTSKAATSAGGLLSDKLLCSHRPVCFLAKDGIEEWSDFPDFPDNEKDDDDDTTPKLGIALNLDPLTEEEAQLLKAEATELINQKIAQGMDDIRTLREELKKEIK